ncbi:MAG TPA: type I methionyl aminopeptidase [Candidatus Parcubacteria bacterium]|nr:type I methionyl aminopeptidase [Candidatus Parcubacteria bacterium]
MISIKTKKELRIMREGGRILARIMEDLKKAVRPGIKTKELERLAQSLVFKYKARCSFLGYEGYPACLCVSVNDEIVHYPPSDRVLKEGDIVSLDFGVLWKGFHTDMALTLPVGSVAPEARRLVKVCKKALRMSLRNVRPGKTIGDISNAIQRYVEDQGFNVVRELCGHGIGRELHEDPQILNYGKRGKGPELKPGMTICIEPMITAGDYRIKKSERGPGYRTLDGSLSAHFEHTIAITKSGPWLLTNPNLF